ncbi:YifB family Mg chelatase-like AAA ATPase [Mycetocola zhujimingii]|uniref:Mg chelatase-like protein n=1 Tax=Mycetocola zhujimingii TaxID=2079792 RepID=A0A2U1TH95_9MICO|nr:YifB family Mg chelatase-like AAA ATPase [Mycetocola zhujimingii]PWC08269.1 Mg chelatase-like protein [Mycetocola zhujimingii]
MTVGRTWAVALLGLDGSLVEVEADISAQLPKFVIIGLADRSLGEAEGRVRQAATNAGCRLSGQRITVNLSPASLPKNGSGFDLAIALSCLAADSVVSNESIDGVVHIGELGLDGRLRPTPGVLPAVLAAVRAGRKTVMVPAGNEHEARLIPDVTVIPVASLREAAIWHGAALTPVEVAPILTAATDAETPVDLDLSDIVGQEDAIQALLVAAAGGHHLMMLGPPGAGKTMLAARLPGILPDLGVTEALDVTSVRSLAGQPIGTQLVSRPPFESPHHTATTAAILGGGSKLIRPGAAARAAHGVLFLDEAPEFQANVLDALRQPLESGTISIHRANAVAHFPGRFQLVLAANPCPCGQYGSRDNSCVCPPAAIRRYLGRLSGPLMDRIDIQLRMHRISRAEMVLSGETAGTHSTDARRLVSETRQRTVSRLAGTGWTTNGQVPGPWLRAGSRALPRDVTEPIDRALEHGSITMRGYDRVLRVAWTLADMDAVPRPEKTHIGRALFLRKGI